MRRKIKKGMRWCSHCKEIKSVTEFYPNASRRDEAYEYCAEKLFPKEWEELVKDKE